MSADSKPFPSALIQYHEYRCYVTPDYWLITYRDADFIRLMRRTEHSPGFALILLELIWDLCRGQRTALRERWVQHSELAEADARKLLLQQASAHNRVIEFWFERKARSTSQAVSKQEEPER